MPKKQIKQMEAMSVDELMKWLSDSAGSANKLGSQPETVSSSRLVRVASQVPSRDIIEALEARPSDALCAWAALVIRAYRTKEQRRVDAESRSNAMISDRP